jgi:hypothetical protein
MGIYKKLPGIFPGVFISGHFTVINHHFFQDLQGIHISHHNLGKNH